MHYYHSDSDTVDHTSGVQTVMLDSLAELSSIQQFFLPSSGTTTALPGSLGGLYSLRSFASLGLLPDQANICTGQDMVINH